MPFSFSPQMEELSISFSLNCKETNLHLQLVRVSFGTLQKNFPDVKITLRNTRDKLFQWKRALTLQHKRERNVGEILVSQHIAFKKVL